jgi:uncharacterized protein (TIGR03083 family)
MTDAITATTSLSKSQLWPLIHEQRAKVLALLDTLADPQWEVPSLCAGWRVRDVVAHNIDTFLMTPPRFIGKFTAAGFRFNSMTAHGVANYRDEPITRLLAEYRSTYSRNTAPPGPLMAMLGEVVIHGEDIARPLNTTIAFTTPALIQVAEYSRSTSPLLHGKQRSAGLRLRATDVDWTAGDGPEVSGPIRALISAITGRTAALSDLNGDGVETLRSRLN